MLEAVGLSCEVSVIKVPLLPVSLEKSPSAISPHTSIPDILCERSGPLPLGFVLSKETGAGRSIESVGLGSRDEAKDLADDIPALARSCSCL